MMTNAFLGEFIGTMIVILLGDGVVANVVLKGTKGNNGGWIVVTFAWAMAVFVGVFISSVATKAAHLNPAVTICLAVAGKFEWSLVPVYLAGQFIGAAAGAILVWAHYKPHFDSTEDPDAKLGAFCTIPAIRHVPSNFIGELIGTFVLCYAVLHISSPEGGLGSLDALPVAFTVLVIGLSLGGTTGYAINPARDFSPRLIHSLLPLANKRDSDWAYAWIPMFGPIAGGVVAVMIYRIAF